MWIKTDTCKLVNLDHYQELYAGKEGELPQMWYVNAIPAHHGDRAVIAICGSTDEAQLVLDNILDMIAHGVVATNINCWHRKRWQSPNDVAKGADNEGKT